MIRDENVLTQKYKSTTVIAGSILMDVSSDPFTDNLNASGIAFVEKK